VWFFEKKNKSHPEIGIEALKKINTIFLVIKEKTIPD
jgi:hypothetical protein